MFSSGNVAGFESSVWFVWVVSLTGVVVSRAMSSLIQPMPCGRPKEFPGLRGERMGIRHGRIVGGEFKECLPCVIELLQIGIVFVGLPLLLGEDATPRTRLVMGQAFEGAQAHKHRYVRIDEFRARSIRVEPLGDIGCKDG
jgi:hypothetical protein